jgi:tetratricopeptide (TPR) repeat protein
VSRRLRLIPHLLALSVLGLHGQSDPWAESYRLEGLKDFRQAAQVIAPFTATNEFAQLRHSYLAYLQGHYDDSYKGYQRALEMNPLSLDARLGMTLPLLAQQRWTEAAARARQVLDQCAWNYTAHVRLLVCEDALKQWDVLARHGQDLARRYPSDATALVYWARGEDHLGNQEGAGRAYQRVLQLYPGHKESLDYLNRPKK